MDLLLATLVINAPAWSSCRPFVPCVSVSQHRRLPVRG